MHVLVVEDDRLLQGALEHKFRALGFRVTTCDNAEEALQALNTDTVDGVVLDLVMPGKDGFHFLEERTKGRNADVPVFVLTNLGRDEDAERAKELGASMYFVKSLISLKDAVEEVQNALEKR